VKNYARSLSVTVVMIGSALMAIGWSTAEPCYCLQRTGCNPTGPTPNFCKKDQVICDSGYSSTARTCDQGERGPLDGQKSRKCYKINGDTITGPCDAPTPSGYEPTFCSNGSGVCCFTKDLNETTGGSGNMTTPSGAACDAHPSTP
jgi:hypothetical protein